MLLSEIFVKLIFVNRNKLINEVKQESKEKKKKRKIITLRPLRSVAKQQAKYSVEQYFPKAA